MKLLPGWAGLERFRPGRTAARSSSRNQITGGEQFVIFSVLASLFYMPQFTGYLASGVFPHHAAELGQVFNWSRPFALSGFLLWAIYLPATVLLGFGLARDFVFLGPVNRENGWSVMETLGELWDNGGEQFVWRLALAWTIFFYACMAAVFWSEGPAFLGFFIPSLFVLFFAAVAFVIGHIALFAASLVVGGLGSIAVGLILLPFGLLKHGIKSETVKAWRWKLAAYIDPKAKSNTAGRARSRRAAPPPVSDQYRLEPTGAASTSSPPSSSAGMDQFRQLLELHFHSKRGKYGHSEVCMRLLPWFTREFLPKQRGKSYKAICRAWLNLHPDKAVNMPFTRDELQELFTYFHPIIEAELSKVRRG